MKTSNYLLNRSLKDCSSCKRWREGRWKHKAGEPSASTPTDTNTSFVTPSTTKQMIAEIWGKKPVETPSKFAIFSMKNPVISDLLLGSCQSSNLVFHNCCLKFSKQRQKQSYFVPFQSRQYNNFEFVLLKQTCPRNHVTNYTSENGLDPK